MTPQTIQTVQCSWAKVLPIAPQAATLFYSQLFQLDPTLQPLFKGDMTAQGKRLMQMIGTAVCKLNDPGTLLPVLQGLGQRHQGYGVQPHHYAAVGQALLATLALGLGSDYTPVVAAAWTEVYDVMAGVMQDAAVMA